MANNPNAFWLIMVIAGALSLVAGIILTKKKMF